MIFGNRIFQTKILNRKTLITIYAIPVDIIVLKITVHLVVRDAQR